VSSDSYSAPVNAERREKARRMIENVAGWSARNLDGHFDSIALHGVAEELEGMSRQFRAMSERSVDEYQDPTPRKYRVVVSSTSKYETEIECLDCDKWAEARARDGGEFTEIGEGTWHIESVEVVE